MSANVGMTAEMRKSAKTEIVVRADTPSLHSLAKDALESTGWNTEQAVQKMCQDVMEYSDLMRDIIERGCRSYVAAVASNRRGALTMGSETERGGTIGSSAVRKAFQACALDTYVVCGKPLRDATANDLRQSIAFHKATSATHGKRAEAEARILKAMGPGVKKHGANATVGKCLSEQQVTDLLRRYSLAAAA